MWAWRGKRGRVRQTHQFLDNRIASLLAVRWLALFLWGDGLDPKRAVAEARLEPEIMRKADRHLLQR